MRNPVSGCRLTLYPKRKDRTMEDAKTSACESEHESMQVKRAPTWSELTTDNKVAVLRDVVCDLLIENSRLKVKAHELSFHSHSDGRPVIPLGIQRDTFDSLQWQLDQLRK